MDAIVPANFTNSPRHSIYYESRGKGFAIFSCGADGKAGTKDDIRSDKKRRSNGKFDSLLDETANPKSDK